MLAALIAGTTAAAADAAEAYRLGAGDRLRIAVFGRADLSGEFRVRETGVVSLPLLGALDAGGLTLAELEESVARAFDAIDLTGLQVSAEVVEPRPFFILGDVAAPGAYPYAGDLTVLHAIAIAGGFARVTTPEQGRWGVATSEAREELAELLAGHRALEARLARLVAERNGADDIAFPPALTSGVEQGRLGELLAGERRILTTRRQALESELAILRQRKRRFEEEVGALEGQLGAEQRQLDLVEQEVRHIRSLSQRGLTPQSRLLELQQLAAAVESELREVMVSVSRAKQQVVDTDLRIASLRNERDADVLAQIQEVQAELVELEDRLPQLAARLQQTQALAGPGAAAPQQLRPDAFIIVRDAGDGPEELPATALTPVRPGDIVRVPGHLDPLIPLGDRLSGGARALPPAG